jgi:hypothetical protein
MSKLTNLASVIGGVFDATQVAPATGGSTLSVGKHIVKIIDGELTTTKDSKGGMVVFTVEAIDPNDPDFGRTMDYRLNIHNENPKAVEIARQQLSAICHVTGVFQVQDLQQLFNIPFMVDVQNQKLTAQQLDKQAQGETVEPYKEIKGVFDTGGAKPGQAPKVAPAQNAQAQQAAQQGAGWGQQPAAQAAPAQQQQAPAQQQQPAWGQQPAQQAEQPASSVAPAQAAPAWGQAQQASVATTAPWGAKP